MKIVDRKCDTCPTFMVGVKSQTKYCPVCSKERKRVQNQKATKRYNKKHGNKRDHYDTSPVTPELQAKRDNVRKYLDDQKKLNGGIPFEQSIA